MLFTNINESKINKLIKQDIIDFESTINLIGSANIPFYEVTKALSYPIFSNPLEGFIKDRVYPKSEVLDELEIIGNEYLRKLFKYNKDDYNTSFQPHSGTTANQIIYNAVLEPNDTVLTMSLNSGGHISHHHYIKKFFKLLTFGLNKFEEIDYKNIENIIRNNNIKLLIVGASSFPNEIKYSILNKICKKYNVFLLADISHTVLFISEGLHESPFRHADFISFTTHKTTRGPRGGIILYKNYFSDQIKNSIFPITQSAPKFYDILSKVIMLIKLSDYDRKSYIKYALKLSIYFIEYFKEKRIKVFTNKTDSHLAILDLTKNSINAIKAESLLAEINILTNRCFLPKDTDIPHGLRFGFLSLAVVKIDINDFKQICDIIFEKLFLSNHSKSNTKTSNIAKKYFKGYYNDK